MLDSVVSDSPEIADKELMDFAKMKVGLRTVGDAIIDVGSYKKINANYGDKDYVLRAMDKGDFKTLRGISNYFYNSSGIYRSLCDYLAYLYRYDWYVNVFEIENGKANESKMLKDFSKALEYMDNSNIKMLCRNIALEIVKNGSYYGCVVEFPDSFGIQQLPSDYCRSRYTSGSGNPVVELNMQWFDIAFPNAQYRLKVLSMFPTDVRKGYILYKQGKLIGDYPGDKRGWYALDPQTTVKFTISGGGSGGGEEYPPLMGVVPSLIDLDQAQDLDRKKTMQQLLKILVQKLPLDKNGELIFDVDEAKDIHNNAVAMLKRAVGIDVLTTFADIIKIDTRDTNSNTSTDDLEKVERTVFNNSGITHNLFNADGNLAVTNSILVDEASMTGLILQFQSFLTRMVKKFSRNNQYRFGATMLETTQFNYKELSKTYEGQTKIGFSKVLPQIALGHSQSSILADAHFENEVLHLSDVMLPPMSSNTMSGSLLGKNNQTTSNKSQSNQTNETGRPEKADSEKSDKTLANKEAMS